MLCVGTNLFVWLPWIIWSNAIIFVHLGPDVPDCLSTTMAQARYWNPTWDIYLLTDFCGKTPEHLQFLENCQLEEGFWTYATERFFLLYDFMKERGLEMVVHLESDTMIYQSLDELDFSGVRLAAPFQSEVGCIPCFVYIRDVASLKKLIDHILEEPEKNDMRTLASFYKKYGEEWMLPLPTLMPEYVGPKHRSAYPWDNRTSLRFLSKHAERFPGVIFDAAGLGIYMNGCDRRFSPDKGAGTIHCRCLFYPNRFEYTWEDGVPWLEYQGRRYKIANLHFYSKMPEPYVSDPLLLHRDQGE